MAGTCLRMLLILRIQRARRPFFGNLNRSGPAGILFLEFFPE